MSRSILTHDASGSPSLTVQTDFHYLRLHPTHKALSMTMGILSKNVSKALLRLREGTCPAVFIQLFHHRRQVGQARFPLGKSILASPNQVAVLKSFLRTTCSINLIGIQVRLTSLVVLWIFLLTVFGRWMWFAMFQLPKNFSVCLIDSHVHLQSRQPTVS